MITARAAPSPSRRPPLRWWPVIRLLGGLSVLAAEIWRFGAGPFLDGISSVDVTAVALAVGIGAVTTVCSAWRWTLVARGLGIGLPLVGAVAAYYRSQFLNTTLPGGVLGDVHRGVRHGQDVDNLGRGLRAVGWERVAGQTVFVAVAIVVLLVLPSPVQSWIPAAVIVLVGAAGAGWLIMTGRAGFAGRVGEGGQFRVGGRFRRQPGRMVGTMSHDISNGLLPAWPKVLLASIFVMVGHLAIFYVAMRSTGTTAPVVDLLPVAVLVLLAMVVPLNIGGWGPREGMAAWAFAATGLGATQGVAAATVYGVLAMVATLPGAAVLLAGLVDRRAGHRATTAEPAKAILRAVGSASENDATRG